MYEFIQARNYTPVAARTPRWILVHTMEAAEKPGTARAVAKWFAGNAAPKASAHYCVDNIAIIQCVKEHDVAWSAPGANARGIHIEHAGFAHQTGAEWGDSYSTAMLGLSAKLAAEICARWAIPVMHLTPEQIRAGEPGIAGHRDVTAAFHTVGGHTDPGPNFPWDTYIAAVQLAMQNVATNG